VNPTEPNLPGEVGSMIHFCGPITLVIDTRGFGSVMKYGDELAVTDRVRADNTDRLGGCVFDLLDDEPAQERRWGRVLLRRGPWPEGEPRTERGSLEWIEARDSARKEAWKIENDTERAQRMAEIAAEFGPPPVTSRSIATYAGDHGG